MLTEQQTTKWSSAVKKLIKTIDNKNSDKSAEASGSLETMPPDGTVVAVYQKEAFGWGCAQILQVFQAYVKSIDLTTYKKDTYHDFRNARQLVSLHSGAGVQE